VCSSDLGKGSKMAGKTRRQRLEELLADMPDDPETRYMLAMEDVSAGDDEAAVRGFREAVRVGPDYAPAYLQLGQALARLGLEDEARATYRAGVSAAVRSGNDHAAREMQGFLEALE